MPQINQNSAQQYYSQNTPASPPSKKKAILVGLGIVILLVLISVVVFGGRSKPGQEDMRSALKSTSEALAITDNYSGDLETQAAKNDIALTQILLRGNSQKLNELYNKTYKPRKKLSFSSKVDTKSAETLDRARRNNTLDSEIMVVLDTKVKSAGTKLTATKKSIKKASARQTISVSISDLNSVEDILNQPN